MFDSLFISSYLVYIRVFHRKNGSQFYHTQNLHTQTIRTKGETSNKLQMYEYVYQFTFIYAI